MHPLSALIVDDEAHSRANLGHLIRTYCPEIVVAGEAASGREALASVQALQPEVVFLDIRMPRMDGFAFLQQAQPRRFSVVFVTAHDAYGIQAVKASAIDYLLKPISIDELRQAVVRLLALHQAQAYQGATTSYQQSLSTLMHQLNPPQEPERVTLPHGQDLVVVELKDIIRLEAEDNYTFVHLRGRKKPLLVPRTLKHMEALLPPEQFVRVHRSHLIHLAYLDAYVKDAGGQIILRDASRVPVSRRRQAGFLRLIRPES